MAPASPSKTFKTTIYRDGAMCFIPVPFDPKPLFGKVRAPVVVTVNGHSYRSTIASMGEGPCLPLRKSNREAAQLQGGETLDVTLTLDEAKREVDVPADLAKALRSSNALARFTALSYSHQREHVSAIEEAKKPETRARRIEGAVRLILAMPDRKPAKLAPSTRGPRLPTQKPSQRPAPSTQKPGSAPKPAPSTQKPGSAPKPAPSTQKPSQKPAPSPQKPRQVTDVKDDKPARPRKPATVKKAPR